MKKYILAIGIILTILIIPKLSFGATIASQLDDTKIVRSYTCTGSPCNPMDYQTINTNPMSSASGMINVSVEMLQNSTSSVAYLKLYLVCTDNGVFASPEIDLSSQIIWNIHKIYTGSYSGWSCSGATKLLFEVGGGSGSGTSINIYGSTSGDNSSLFYNLSDTQASISISYPVASSTGDFEAFQDNIHFGFTNYNSSTDWVILMCSGENSDNVDGCWNGISAGVGYSADDDTAKGISRDSAGGLRITPNAYTYNFHDFTDRTGVYVAKKQKWTLGHTYYAKALLMAYDSDAQHIEVLGVSSLYTFTMTSSTYVSNLTDQKIADFNKSENVYDYKHMTSSTGIYLGFQLNTCGSISITDFSQVSCYVDNMWKSAINNIGSGINNTMATIGSFIKGIFPINVFAHIQDDFQTVGANKPTDAMSTLTFGSASSSIFGGKTYTVISPAVMASVSSNLGFDFRGFFSKVMYTLTGLLMITHTLLVINHFRKAGHHQIATTTK